MLDLKEPTSQTSLPEAYQVGLNERIESGKLDLPLLPDVVMEVMNLSNSDNADPAKLADILHRDQTLAGHVLRVANSPAYKPRMPIVSLQQAVSRLGMTQLSEIAYTVSVQSCVFKVKGFEDEVAALWQHALSAGVYSKEIARTKKYDVDKAFLWGLLHDVGKPVVLLTLAELQKELNLPLKLQAVIETMDAYHTQVGGILAKYWELPAMIQESILFHHHYQAAPSYPEAAMVTCLADHLSYHLMDPDQVSEESVRQHPVIELLRCSSDDVDALLAKREQVLEIIKSMNP
jgi:HD-like signal output (HDOD) protein